MKTHYKLNCLFAFLLFAKITLAQTPIVTVNVTTTTAAGSASYTASGASGSSLVGNTYNYTFGAATQTSYNLKDLNNFVLGSDVFSYSYSANSYVKIRRVDNAQVTGNRSLLWLESIFGTDPSKISVINPYKENMENIFDDNTFNAGTDNIFGNQGDGNGNNNNIERFDVIFPYGIVPADNGKSGFAVFERGDDNVHDPFVIAPITAIDAAGNPTAYGKIVRVATNKYGNIPSSSTNYNIVRRDIAIESNLRVSTSGTQNIGGVFLSLSDLNISNGTRVYGYSLFPVDLKITATSADLVDYTNATNFPRSTSSNTTLGGLDLLAITGIFGVPNSILIPPTAYDIVMPPIINAVTINPFIATAVNTTIATYTVQTIPPASQGVLSAYVAGILTPVVPGQVLTPSQITTMTFVPDTAFTGNVVFTYSATDNHNLKSNIANYTIPVIARPTSILEIKLSDFTVVADNKSIQLNWQTVSELNSSYFEIQRSYDGKNFEPIATETARNGGAAVSNYTTTDDLFFYTGTVAYYRLKMVTIFGTYTWSPTVKVQLDATSQQKMKVWPNPFESQFTLSFNSDTSEPVSIMVSSSTGAVLYNYNATAKKGFNSIVVHTLHSPPQGIYLVTLRSSTKTEIISVVKK